MALKIVLTLFFQLTHNNIPQLLPPIRASLKALLKTTRTLATKTDYASQNLLCADEATAMRCAKRYRSAVSLMSNPRFYAQSRTASHPTPNFAHAAHPPFSI